MSRHIYLPIPVEDRLPANAWIGCVLIDGRLPMMAQLRPDVVGHKWFTLGMAQAKEIPKGVTHWLEPYKLDYEQLKRLIPEVQPDFRRKAGEGMIDFADAAQLVLDLLDHLTKNASK